MMLVDDGKLKLDDPVSKYIHAFADAKVGVDLSDEAGQYPLKLEPLKRPITIRGPAAAHLGHDLRLLRRQVVDEALCQSKTLHGRFRQCRVCRPDRSLPLAEQPGTRWNYGHSTDVLGRVVEVVSARPCINSKRERCSMPLGMTDTAYDAADRSQRHRIAKAIPSTGFRVAGIRDPTTPRRWESGGAAWSRPWATMPASCRCCSTAASWMASDTSSARRWR